MTLLGWVGNILLFISMLRIGSKKRDGFLWTLAGEAAWATKAVVLGMPDLLAVCLMFSGLAIWNWFRWAPNGQEKPQIPA